ncbi:MAG: cytochrome C, partial [SAR202 cluster bacterium]|nr:cytochrome C [SAR202 cluster bacterium]
MKLLSKIRFKKLLLAVVGVLVFTFGILQAIPYGRDHSNPPVRAEPVWASDQTRDLAVKACFDCHSNESVWPWYSTIAPVSWLVYKDVVDGREHLNFSEWDRRQEADEAAEAVLEGEMPAGMYTWTHPDVRLSAADRAALAQ